MKYCEEYAALLDLFVDGELTGPEMERVRDHLETCPGCRAYVDDALVIRAGFPDVEETAVPEGFAEGVMARVREDAAKGQKVVELQRRGFRRWMGTAAALAACCALVVLVRTGPGKDAAAPAGDGAAYDTAEATIAGEETEIAPQAAPESKETTPPAEDAPEETVRMAPEARSKMAEFSDDESNRQLLEAAPTEGASQGMEPAAAPEAAKDEEKFHACPPVSEKTLYLTAEEAGDLLDGYVPAQADDAERHYELNAEEYRALLEALGRQEELPESAEGPFLVVVTGPLE